MFEDSRILRLHATHRPSLVEASLQPSRQQTLHSQASQVHHAQQLGVRPVHKLKLKALALHEIPTVSDFYASRELRAAADPRVPPVPYLNTLVSFIEHDIARLQVDCIVNAAKESLQGGGGVDRAMHLAAGPKLNQACIKKLQDRQCSPGRVFMTPGFHLRCKSVIHTVGPDCRQKQQIDYAQVLRQCYRNSLNKAVSKGLRSIVFPAISVGVYACPAEATSEIALNTVRGFLDEHGRPSSLDRIGFCNLGPNIHAIY
ncbi:Appr-1-p processing enzyme family protein [Aspergillus fischeri NRRL 181]|uniref:Appr-1-p processing enzyme family protein n=1 Tax=Neosartorya fischeri (strain ATCC 1020 / DSM 3700 / CBS 544.65 / FGSC A1164 / JCM 1740 / NRRL 181 / WB 181) TaxID=331117 RepID=A1D5K4_NEOFI|nr:Appr-1-p processing enzyme family protein [Aspergillus fischeri NRRL 181]EAW22058.1 Appr-1-p processing enzyme family protein [Aspergillus fischeri NRRL 181]